MPITVDIPGGTADLYQRNELTARRNRAIEVVALQSSSVVAKVQKAGAATTPTGEVVTADANQAAADALANVELSEKEAAVFFRIQDANIYAYLKSWTLAEPLPETIDAVQDIPLDVYEALREHVNKVTAPVPAESFEPNDASLENTESPSGSSGD